MNPARLTLVVVACAAFAATSCRRESDAVAPRAPAPERALPTAEAIDPGLVATELVAVGAGFHRPLYGKDVDRIEVAAFRLERRPVTNAQFLAFVRANPAWRRSFVKRLFADDGYLAHWPGELELLDDQTERPVTHVSWFAARAYAQWLGRRLPTLAEWELAAADFDDAEATLTPRILEWYGRASTAAPSKVGSGLVARSGIEDLHGLVWEWVEDFNSALVTGESRGDPGLERSLFCGSGAVNAANPSDYAAFMRYALRSSLRAPYTVKNLGFRCAENAGDCCSTEEPAALEALPDASLWQLASRWTDHTGRARVLSEWRGRPTLVAMVFTNCRYACPRLAADARRVLDALRPDERARLRGVLVTFDTERDTPERLAAFAKEQGLDTATWTLLRGNAADVRELAAVLGVAYQQAPSGDFAHSNVITLVDADGVIVHRQQGLEVEPIGSVIAIRALLRDRP
ncbi:MAG: SUMF1/EgtB/PvdO family nonheme iron enzyme [Planctomycetes bacterium]|nr:SUMF1/EgtB/PvdO family nonheme iron enzyme [Planctomycetota bacterium]